MVMFKPLEEIVHINYKEHAKVIIFYKLNHDRERKTEKYNNILS